MSPFTLYKPSLKYIAICILAVAFSACDTSVKSDSAEIGEAIDKKRKAYPTDTFMVDTAKSELTWIGAKITGRHNGIFKIKTGTLHLSNGLLTDGKILIDMNQMRSDDKTIDSNSNAKLTKHLKSADFFDTEKYPTAVFELTGMAPLDTTEAQEEPTNTLTSDKDLRVQNPTHRITGNLTIKNKTKSISFPAKVTLEDEELKAKANFNIDRTQWDLIYRSDKSLGDQTIHPDVNIGFNIVAKPKS